MKYHGPKNAFSIYPNPIVYSSRLFAERTTDVPINLRLLSISGEQIIDFNGSLEDFNNLFPETIGNQPNGVYILIVRSDEGVFKIKMIKNE